MQKSKLNNRIIITGGGSGGHVSAATAILSELEKRYDNTKEMIMYVGGDLAMIGDKDGKSIEERRFENKGYKFVKVRAGKLQRYFSVTTLKLLFRSVLGVFDANNYVKEFKPDFIISTGGYVSVPVALAAYFQKVPLYIHEQTAAVGLTNKIAGKIAKKIFVTFKESLQYFPKEKTQVIGNPVRDEIFQKNTGTPLLDQLELMKKESETHPIIYISGGGQGSHIINTAIRNAIFHLLDKYQIILQTGDNQSLKDFDVLTTDRSKLSKEKKARFLLTKFVTDFEIGAVFDACQLYMGRSGANTVYELGVLSIPSILIPIPWVTHNEQEKNARVLERIGIGTILREGELSRENLLSKIETALEKKTDIVKSEEFNTDAAYRLVNEIEELH